MAPSSGASCRPRHSHPPDSWIQLSFKKAHGFTNEIKQAPLTRKVKEGTEIPKAYGDAGKFTNPQWHAAERKEMTGILDHESWQEIEQSLATAEMRKKALRAHHFYDLKRSMDAKNRAHNPHEPMPSKHSGVLRSIRRPDIWARMGQISPEIWCRCRINPGLG